MTGLPAKRRYDSDWDAFITGLMQGSFTGMLLATPIVVYWLWFA